MKFQYWTTERDILFADVRAWCSWTFKQSVVQYEKVRLAVISVLKRLESLACAVRQQHTASYAKWSMLIRRAMRCDIEDLEANVVCAISTNQITPNSFKFWELRTFMDLLLTVRIGIPEYYTVYSWLCSIADKPNDDLESAPVTLSA